MLGGDRELGPGLLPRRAGVVCPGTGPVVDTSTRVGARQVSNGQELFSVYGHNTYSRSGLSPDKDRTVFGGFEDGRAQVRSVVENRLLFELEGHTGMVLAARYSPVGEQVATASMDGSVRLWQAEDGSPLATLTGHNGPVCAIQYSPDGAQMASIGDDAVLRIWVVRDGRLLKSIEPDQKMIVISQSDGLVSLWGVPTGQ